MFFQLVSHCFLKHHANSLNFWCILEKLLSWIFFIAWKEQSFDLNVALLKFYLNLINKNVMCRTLSFDTFKCDIYLMSITRK